MAMDHVLKIRINDEQLSALATQAAVEHRSVSDLARLMLAQALPLRRAWDPPFIVECPACGARSRPFENGLAHIGTLKACQASQLRVAADQES
jgi:hypothetical protein